MTCPICSKKEINDDQSKCPQCDSDLSIINLLRKLKSGLKYGLLQKGVLIFSIITIIVFIIIYSISMKKNDLLIAENKKLFDSLSVVQKSEMINTQHSERIEISYKIRKYDTLWGIAEFFYNDGKKYEKIMVNNFLKSENITEGQILRILLD